MPRWLTYLIVLAVGAGVGFAYMEIQSRQLVDRISASEAQLAEASAKAERLEAKVADLEAEVAGLEGELAEKTRMVAEQAARIRALEESLEAAPSPR